MDYLFLLSVVFLLFCFIFRKRIAEKLHDDTVQDIICLSQKLELAMLYMDKDLVQAKLELALAKKQIRVIMDGVRDTIYDLRPMILDDIGYDAAFGRLRDMLIEKGYVDFLGTDLHRRSHADAIDAYLVTKDARRHADALRGRFKNDKAFV